MRRDWPEFPVWSVMQPTKRQGHAGETLLSVYRDYGVIPKDSRDDNHNRAGMDLSVYQLVEPGDVVMNKMKAWQGSIAVSAHRGIVSPDYMVLKVVREGVLPGFLHYLLRSGHMVSEYRNRAYGVRPAQWRLMYPDFRTLRLPLPELWEQRAIADFLDRKTAPIDALIEKKERLVALLAERRAALIHRAVTRGLDPGVEMKDSGVEWIGEVPAHWGVKRLKFLCHVRGGVTKGRDLTGRETTLLPYLRVANVQDGYLDLAEVARIEVGMAEVGRYSLRPGDILMNEGGDNDKLGRGAVWEGQLPVCLHQNHVFAVRPHPEVNPYWINLVTQSNGLKTFFQLHAKQTTNLASISSSNLKEAPILWPPAEEQHRILDQVSTATQHSDALTEKAAGQLDCLREYRQALMTAAVTGQIQIPTTATRPPSLAVAQEATP